MNQRNTDITSILAIGRLFQFTANKRFHLIDNNFINDEIGKKALELNYDIKNSSGIDVFEAKTDDDLLEYQRLLDNYTTKINKQTFGDRSIAEELELLENQITFSKDRWESLQILIPEFIKPNIRAFNITIPGAINYLKTPDNIIYIEKYKLFFLTKKVFVNKRERIFFSILSAAVEEVVNTSKRFENVVRNPDYVEFHKTAVYNVLLFKEEKFSKFGNDPLRLFFKALDLYGHPLTIGTNTSRLKLDTVLPPSLTDPHELRNFLKVPVGIHMTSYVTVSHIAVNALIIYALNEKKFIKDFLIGHV
jgi:hypothetical protein